MPKVLNPSGSNRNTEKPATLIRRARSLGVVLLVLRRQKEKLALDRTRPAPGPLCPSLEND